MGIFNNKYPYTDFHEMNLDWIIDKLKDLDTDTIRQIIADLDAHLQGEIDDINAWISNYDASFVKDAVEKYIATMIMVEISDAGYIIYNIPETWDEIVFNTTDVDIVIPDVDYGHLVLSY